MGYYYVVKTLETLNMKIMHAYMCSPFLDEIYSIVNYLIQLQVYASIHPIMCV